MDAQILAELQALNQTLANMGNDSLSGSTDLRASRAQTAEEKALLQRWKQVQNDQKKSFEEFKRIAQKNSQTVAEMSHASKITATAFQNVVDNASLEDLDTKFVDTFRSALEGSNNSIVASLGAGINDMTEVMGLEMELQARNAFIGLRSEFKEGEDDVNVFLERLEAAGVTAKQAKRFLDETVDGLEDLQEETLELASAMNDATGQFSASSTTILEAGRNIAMRYGFLAAGAAALAKELYQAGSAAAKFGTDINSISSVMLGMSPAELSELQAEHKQTIMATSQSYEEFNSLLGTNNMEMRAYAGTLAEVTKLNGNILSSYQMLGGAISGQADYLEQQQATFKSWNRTFSTTAEQFQEMNKQMLTSTDMQASLYKMDKLSRVNAQQDLQNSYEKLRVDGLMHEEAMNVLDTFNKISGTMDPKERMKQAAKLQAYAGTLGMGEEGARMAELQRGGLRGEGDKEEFAALLAKVNEKSSERQSAGLGSELVDSALINRLGIQDLVGPLSMIGRTATRDGLKISGGSVEELAQKMEVLPKYAGEALAIADMGLAFMQGPLYAGVLGIAGGITALVTQGGIANATTAGAASNLGKFGKLMAKGGLVGSVGMLAYEGTKLAMEATGAKDALSSLIPDAESTSIDTIKEDVKILKVLEKMSLDSEKAMIHGMTQLELMKIAQKINEENKSALTDQTAIIAAYEDHKARQSRKTQRGGNRRRREE